MIVSSNRRNRGARDATPGGKDPLGQAVSDAWSGERLAASQRDRHLARLRATQPVATRTRASTSATTHSDERLLPSATGNPPAARRPRRLWLAGGMAAVAVAAALLLLVYKGPANTPPSDRLVAGAYSTPEGWSYSGAELPGGGQIAFSRLDDDSARIAIINADGTGLRTLADDGATQTGPSWSQDGEWLAYTGTVNSQPQVYVMGADGTAARQRTSYRGAIHPVWSPDGTRIAFISEQDSRVGLYVMNADGTNPRNVSADIPFDGSEYPRWSPDSRQLVFGSGGGIYVVNADGTSQRRVTDDPRGDVMPEWSPTGAVIVFSSRRDGNAELYTIDPGTLHTTRLTETPGDETYPVWSPDGREIAYSFEPEHALPGTETYLHVMRADGTEQRRLVEPLRASEGIAPSWSPDGRRIAFAAQAYGTYGIALYVVNRDGTGLRNLGVELADLSRPVWRPLWWPRQDTSAAATGIAALSVTPAEGDCNTPVTVRGEHFPPDAAVSLYAAPVPDANFSIVASSVTVAPDGSFTTVVDPGVALACRNGVAPDGGVLHLGATIERGERDGAFLADLSATVTFTVTITKEP